MLKTFFSGLEWERHCHQMGLAAGVVGEEKEEEEEEEEERQRVRSCQCWSRVRHKLSNLTDSIVLTNPSDSTEELCKQISLAS